MELFDISAEIGKELKDICPVYDEFDDGLVSSKEKNIIVTGIKDFQSDVSGVFWNGSVLVSVLSALPTSGGKMLDISRKIIDKLTSSKLNITEYKAKTLSFDEKLQRLRYELEFKISGKLSDSFLCDKESLSLVLAQNLTLSVRDFSFSRKRGLSEIQTSEGVIVGDSGVYPLCLTLKGTLTTISGKELSTLETLISEKTPLALSFIGNNLPTLVLKEYSFDGNNNSAARNITLLLFSENPSERVTENE
ncbi:MAG TPA: hypothetical protein PKI60_01455 [Oscillospiraceae bacterium]|nr:hypothetical protein [Oscillospiraceae bacterium]